MNIKALPLDRNSIMISWLPPSQPNGEILGYSLYMKTMEKGRQFAQDFSLGSHINYYTMSGLHQVCLISFPLIFKLGNSPAFCTFAGSTLQFLGVCFHFGWRRSSFGYCCRDASGFNTGGNCQLFTKGHPCPQRICGNEMYHRWDSGSNPTLDQKVSVPFL